MKILARTEDEFYDDFDDEYVDYDWQEKTEEEYLSDDFRNIEDAVLAELGIYLDTSSVRGSDGEVFIFSDPDNENDSDMWMGDDDALIDQLDWQDYMFCLSDEVFSKDKSEWKDAYKALMQRLCK